jgi:hypothetical protein
MTTFIVDGQEKELRMDVNGMDISGDFIGNTHHGMASDDEGNYIATKEDFDWWRKTIAAHLAMEETIARYKQDNDPALVDQVVQDWIDTDLDDQPDQVTLGLKQAFA